MAETRAQWLLNEEEAIVTDLEHKLEERLREQIASQMAKLGDQLVTQAKHALSAMMETHPLIPSPNQATTSYRPHSFIQPLQSHLQSHHFEPGGGRSSLIPAFPDFSKLTKRSVEKVLDDPMAELKQLKETNGIVEYHGKFELISNRANLSEPYLVNAFLAGLWLDTQSYVQSFRPQTVRQCLVLGRLYEFVYTKSSLPIDNIDTDPIVCSDAKDAPAGSFDGDELADPVLDTSSASLMKKGVETLQSMLEFEVVGMETNSSVKVIGSRAVRDVQVTGWSHEEESHTEKETKPVEFRQMKTLEKKVSNSLLEPDHTIEELQLGLLANYCSLDDLGAVVSSSLSCGKRVGTAELQACISRQANHVWEPGIFVYPEIQTRWLERVDNIGTLKHCVAGVHVGYIGVIKATLGVEFHELEYRKLDIAHCSEVHEFANTFGNIGGTRHLAFDPGGMNSLYILQSGLSDNDLLHARESCGKTAKFVRVIEMVDEGESLTNKETKPEVFHQIKNFKNKTCCMRKQLKYKNWKFKYKGMSIPLFAAHLRRCKVNHKRKKRRGSKSRTFKYKTAIELCVLMRLPSNTRSAILKITLLSSAVGADSSSIWHRWRYKFILLVL